LTESEKKAYLWGERVKGLIQTVINLKDEIITVGIVMATAFAASKIVSGVAAAIIGINTLIKAYNALKGASIIAGIASAFALNPALGVGAVALALPVLAAASKIAGMYDTKGITNEPSMGSTLDWNAIAKGSSVGGGNIDTSGAATFRDLVAATFRDLVAVEVHPHQLQSQSLPWQSLWRMSTGLWPIWLISKPPLTKIGRTCKNNWESWRQ
jgi:hypothetical protein